MSGERDAGTSSPTAGDARPVRRLSRHTLFVIAAAATAAVLIVTAIVWVSVDLSNRRTVPDLRGKTASAAVAAIKELDLVAKADTKSVPGDLDDTFTEVVAQVPEAGTTIYRDEAVKVTVAPAKVEMPDVVGDTYSDAKEALEAVALTAQHNFGTHMPSDEWPVVGQKQKPGAKVPAGSSVEVTLKAPKMTVPDVVGEERSDAEIDMVSAYLEGSCTGEGDYIRSVDPAPGTEVDVFSKVTMALGYKVPDVVGEYADTAMEMMEDAGFTSVSLSRDNSLKVTKQSVPAGTITDADTKIVLTVPLEGTTYRVSGNCTVASVTWAAPDSFSIEQDLNASLPWEKHFDSSGGFVNFNAQLMNGNSITCTVIRDGEEVMSHTSTGQFAVVSCAG